MRQYLVTVWPEVYSRCTRCPFYNVCKKDKETIKVKVRFVEPYEDDIVLYYGGRSYIIL